MDPRIRHIIARDRVIAGRDHPGLARQLAKAVRFGELVAVLPGTYVATSTATDLETRARAVCSYDRGATIAGKAAAALTFWPELAVNVLEVATTRSRLSHPNFTFSNRAIPRALIRVRRGLRIADPALTALDLVTEFGADSIDRVLRSRRTTLANLHRALALTPNRRGNTERRAVLLDSRDASWSQLERIMHRLLRAAGITGWSTNVRIDVAGNTYYLDIAFRDVPLVIELDGREFHGVHRFDGDRERGNDLVLHGKLVLRFTWNHVVERPGWVIRQVRRGLARCAGMR